MPTNICQQFSILHLIHASWFYYKLHQRHGSGNGIAVLSVCWLVHHSGLDYSVSSTSGWIARKVWSCSPKNKSDVSNSTISKKRLKFAARVALLVLLANFANTKIVNVVNISMFTLILACTLNMPCLAKPLTLTYPQPPPPI